MSQMILGYKYLQGLGVPERCKASVLYYEEAALQAIRYVEESNGLDIVERKKLSIGPHVLKYQMQVVDSQAEKAYGDIFEFLDLKGDYGSADSLAVLGIQHLHGTKRIKRDFERARLSFERALKIDKKDIESNYHMGLIYLLGLGVQKDIEKAVTYFE